jgi:hypothetical protein
MNDEISDGRLQAAEGEQEVVEDPSTDRDEQNFISRWFETLANIGLGEAFLRIGTHVLSLLLVIIVAWLMRNFYQGVKPTLGTQEALAAGPTATPAIVVGALPAMGGSTRGISRLASIHTSIPTRPRLELTQYTVVQGDTIIGIADKFGLKPQTILWGNYDTLRDDPHNLLPGEVLNILPTDGTFYQWQAGDGLNGVAKFFGVKPEDIVNFPGNHLTSETAGDFSAPTIKPGTWLIVPGGTRQFISWSAPIGVTRENPGIARVLGPGACGTVTDGAVGFGTFVWPANKHYLSGFDYSPETNHRGIDIAGNLGEGVYAVDAGVVVYAGWNDWGYGNMIMIDHGNGWQSLYAHLSGLNVVCGQSVGQGEVIGAIGSTGNSSGPHLHFELMHTIYSKVNPWAFLPPP